VIKTILSSETAQARPDSPAYLLAPDVFLVLVADGSARLLDLAGDCFALPPVGARMLRDTLERGTGAAVADVAAEFGVELAQVQRDFDHFLNGLQRRRLLRRARTPPRRSRSLLPSLILMPVLRWLHRPSRPAPRRVWGLLALARVSFRLFGWARTIAAWQRYHGQPPGPDMPANGAALDAEQAIGAIDEAVRRTAAHHPLAVTCKERALCCWSLLRALGLPATLVVGLNLFPLEGHCWCEAGTRVLTDYPDRCAHFTPVVKYS
jgi:hypothetical protein